MKSGMMICSLACAALSLAGTASASHADKDIVTTAIEAGQFKTLATALGKAGLIETLKGPGPFTVFAPTDAAFAKLPKHVLQSLLQPENKDKLKRILAYHVVAGRKLAGDLVQPDGMNTSVTTLAGEAVNVRADSGGARVNESRIVKTDIGTANGVIHVIDTVLLPPEPKAAALDGPALIEGVIARGVHLYNTGHHEACANLYHQAAQQLLTNGDGMPPPARQRLRVALAAATRECATPRERAWTLRRALDDVYDMMPAFQPRR